MCPTPVVNTSLGKSLCHFTQLTDNKVSQDVEHESPLIRYCNCSRLLHVPDLSVAPLRLSYIVIRLLFSGLGWVG